MRTALIRGVILINTFLYLEKGGCSMKNKTFLILLFIAILTFAALPAEASAEIISGSGTIGIVAMVVVVIICTYLMKKFMG